MNRPVPAQVLARLALAAGLVVTLAQPAQAALSGPVSVSLIAPGGIVSGWLDGGVITDVIDDTPIDESASIDPALGLYAGDEGNPISSYWMLPGESITFDDNTILLRVAAGTQRANGDLVTGYLGSVAGHARYSFNGLVIAGQTLIGANVLALNGVISGAGGGLTAPGQVSFYLDDLKFTDPGTGTGNAFGEFRIELLTQPVPEPASWALMLAGLAGIVQLARRATAGKQPA